MANRVHNNSNVWVTSKMPRLRKAVSAVAAFDSSFKRGQAVDLRANQVIKGWTEALVHMPAGSVWEVYIPQQLAYGEREQGQIKPFSVLIFKIELISWESCTDKRCGVVATATLQIVNLAVCVAARLHWHSEHN